MLFKRKKVKGEPLGKSYWRLWTAHAVSNLGDGVSQVAILGWPLLLPDPPS